MVAEGLTMTTEQLLTGPRDSRTDLAPVLEATSPRMHRVTGRRDVKAMKSRSVFQARPGAGAMSGTAAPWECV